MKKTLRMTVQSNSGHKATVQEAVIRTRLAFAPRTQHMLGKKVYSRKAKHPERLDA